MNGNNSPQRIEETNDGENEGNVTWILCLGWLLPLLPSSLPQIQKKGKREGERNSLQPSSKIQVTFSFLSPSSLLSERKRSQRKGGKKEEGKVNHCLFLLFANIAESEAE